MISNGSSKTIAVIYLMWYPLGFGALKSFIASYQEYNAGIDHDLYIIFKDFPSQTESDSFLNFLSSNAISYKHYFFYKGFDIDAYFFALEKIHLPVLFFLNTNSIILADNWLKNMYTYIIKESIGVVAATGSWASHSSAVFTKFSWKWNLAKPVADNIKKYRTLLKNLLYWKWFFKSFPNPHVRTNSFMVRREVFAKIKFLPIKTKFQAYYFESGKNGFSNQLRKLGYQLLIVDKNGNATPMLHWNKTNIFWQMNQSNLMIADKQTIYYQTANAKEKQELTTIAWGKIH